MSAPRVMLVIEATAGGTARYMETVVPALAARDLQLHVVCAAQRDPSFRRVMEGFRAAGVRVTELSMVRELSPLADAVSLVRLCRLLRGYRPDVVHVHSSKAGALGRLAAAIGATRKPLYSPHAFAFLDGSRAMRSRVYLMVEKLLARWTGMVVAVSESEAQLAVRHRLAPANRVCVVPNGIDAASATPLRRPSGVRCPATVGFLGRMEAQKDPMRFVDLVAELVRRGIRAEFRCGGSGPLLEPCRRRAQTRGVAGRIQFLGHIIDGPAFYDSLEVFVVTSRFEGLPYTLLDTMVRGVPVVGFDVPGVRDLVIPEVTGLLAPPGDVSALADAVARLLADPSLARELAVRAARRAASEFSLDRQADALARLYRIWATPGLDLAGPPPGGMVA